MRTIANHRLYIKPVNTPAKLFEWLSYSTITGLYVAKSASAPVITRRVRRSVSIVWS